MALKPHAVCMPCPAQGHINSMLKLAQLLHFNGFHITFVHSEFNYNRIIKANGTSSLKGLDDFRFETIPDGLPPSDESVNQDVESLANSVQTTCVIPFRNLLMRLYDHPLSGVPPVSCIISDSFTSYTLEVAKELNIPDFFFCSISACSYMGCIYYKELIDRGITPFKSESDLSNGYLDTPVEWIPGLKNIRLRDLPSFIRTTDPADKLLNFVNKEAQKAFEATAIILNTFDELEDEVLIAMASILPPLYTVGPLTLLNSQFPVTNATSIGSSFLKEDENCLEWLDKRETGSVLYVNFGSLAVVSHEQMIELAWGLANSKHHFLWIIRPDLLKGEAAVLPEEWLDEIKERGLLAIWCPQERVLSHPSVGGFFTHSGWNSTMESVSVGKPMICWPYFGDQQTNCKYVCNEWGMGMEIDSEVKREQVEELIVELMDGEKGKEMKKKVVEWKEKAMRATEEGGSSFMNFKRVIDLLLLPGKKSIL
ncbi:7-deoxyloganetin glucosyltransferase-like [Dioscorea cayenensis subsp. rotundata]|uniref:Glycosyltransferase n=1 Tax=Dioscorea cayennensis subsp. rotundata TaxID=55577 RepID=A0AB40AJL6_DIOCR|nr:7-deoxyloganetin glucosyltransferase-like [Dioscorea cayenensis subsp. rotundata]